MRKDLNKAIRDIPDNRFPGACCLVARVTSAWGVLEQTSKDKVARFVEGGPASEVLNGLAVLSKLDGLKQTAGRRVNSLDFDELAEAITLHGLKSIAKERALYFLSQAGTWNRANEVFQKIVFPVLESLLPSDVERMIRMPTDTGADLPGAHGFTLFIEKVRQTGILDGPALNELLAEHGAGYLVSQDEIA